MKIFDLIEKMSKYPPDTEVLVWVGDDLRPVRALDYDCLHPAGPWVFTVDTVNDEDIVEAVAVWLDGAGPYPVMPANPLQAAREAKLRLVANTGGELDAA